MIRKTITTFSVALISFMLVVFLCGCKSQISDETPATVIPAMDIRSHWNPNGSKIIFVSDRYGNREIYVMDADGSNQIRLTNDSNRDDNPTWSPDGSKIAYSSLKERQNDIYVMNPDGSNKTNLTENSPSDWFGSWSPDGKKIAFQSNRDGNMEVYAMNADGSDQTRLTDNPSYDGNPNWSPDSSRIVYVAGQEVGDYEIYTMDADGSNQIRLTNDFNRDDNPTWSPDGSKIAYNSYNEEQNDIYIMDADGLNQTNLTERSPSDWFESWSPDGRKMIFRSNRDGNWELYVMNADGSGQTRLTSHPAEEWNPVWSPDGSKIAFSSDRSEGLLGDIYVMDAEGADPQNLTNNDVIPGKEIRDIKYGEHERNVLDLWLAIADEPTPLVVYYHGGGFRGGDKRNSMPAPLLLKLLEAGISVAGVNYRLTDTAPFPAQMLDSARALQFIRYHAEEYNVESSRIGATGGSAGAAISMWLAFHDDLADPDNEDSILRESTRLTAVVPYNGQSSADPRFIQELFNTDQISSSKIPFFGMSGLEDIHNPKFFPLFEKASAINYASSDDPPVYMYYYQPNLPLPPNSTSSQYSHHPKYGIALKEKLDNLGVECILKFRKDYPDGLPFDEYVKFFCEKFGMTEKKK